MFLDEAAIHQRHLDHGAQFIKAAKSGKYIESLGRSITTKPASLTIVKQKRILHIFILVLIAVALLCLFLNISGHLGEIALVLIALNLVLAMGTYFYSDYHTRNNLLINVNEHRDFMRDFNRGIN